MNVRYHKTSHIKKSPLTFRILREDAKYLNILKVPTKTQGISINTLAAHDALISYNVSKIN